MATESPDEYATTLGERIWTADEQKKFAELVRAEGGDGVAARYSAFLENRPRDDFENRNYVLLQAAEGTGSGSILGVVNTINQLAKKNEPNPS